MRLSSRVFRTLQMRKVPCFVDVDRVKVKGEVTEVPQRACLHTWTTAVLRNLIREGHFLKPLLLKLTL